MKKYSEEHVKSGGKRLGESEIDQATKLLDEERLSMFFVDHVMENDKKQDYILVASILDALCYRIRKQLPGAEEIAFISDNARNYNNDFLPILLPKICDSHNLLVRTYLHPDPCCGKSCVDGHFAVIWRLVKRYIQETENDVLTPEDMMDALTYDGGIKNSTVDYIKVNRNHATTLNIKLAETLHMVTLLGTPAEIRYTLLSEGKYAIRTYKYSNCQYEQVLVDGFESLKDLKHKYAKNIDKPDEPGVPEEVEIEPKTGLPKKPKGQVMQSTIERRRKTFKEAVMKRTITEHANSTCDNGDIETVGENRGTDLCAEHGECREHVDGESDEIPAAQRTDTNVTNMSVEVLGRRRCSGKVMYYLLKPIVTFIATGVEVKYMGGIHFWKRDAYISSKTPFEDINEHMKLSSATEEQLEIGRVNDAQHRGINDNDDDQYAAHRSSSVGERDPREHGDASREDITMDPPHIESMEQRTAPMQQQFGSVHETVQVVDTVDCGDDAQSCIHNDGTEGQGRKRKRRSQGPKAMKLLKSDCTMVCPRCGMR